MIQRQLKLKLSKQQENKFLEWFYYLTGVWNWAIRKIELDAEDKIYHSKFDFKNILAGHHKKLGIPSHVIQSILEDAYTAWQRCFKKISKKPRLKGVRNKLNGITFPDPIKSPKNNKIKIPYLGEVKYFKQEIPEGKIKRARLVKKSSGYYLCLFIDAEPNKITIVDNQEVGIDPGFSTLLTLSNGIKYDNPKELQKSQKRLAQAQRGGNTKLVGRLHEKIKNQKKDRNHKLSRELVSKYAKIYMSKDDLNSLKKTFGKSVANSNHGQLRQMIAYKSRSESREYVEVESKNTTKTCSNCKSLTGPSGKSGLSVRVWKCKACGAEHDRDINAAINVFKSGAG